MRQPQRRGGDKAVDLAEQKKKEAEMPIAGWLLIMSGPQKGDDFRIREGKTMVGSDPTCEVHLTDGSVSTRHASITFKREGPTSATVKAIDLDSTNGTFHNDDGERASVAELVDNDTITFGTTRCKFKCVG